jgi:hypothetical protein
MDNFNNLQSHTKFFSILLALIAVCIFYYVVKNYKTINSQLKLILIIIIIAISFKIYDTIINDNQIQSLVKNFDVTNGKVIKHIRGKGKAISYIEFKYYVNNIKIVKQYDDTYYSSFPIEKPNFNSDYLVIYEKGNPNNSLILLNYELKDKNDLEKYKIEFQKNIPENALNHR